jgi:hypothetical protein
VAKEANVPIFFEPVSVAKSIRASKFLNLVSGVPSLLMFLEHSPYCMALVKSMIASLV